MSVTARKTILGLVVLASLLVAAVPAHAAHSCVTGATTTTCTFSYAGAKEAWIVPAGVTAAVFDVYGAQGGHFSVLNTGGQGGKGGHVQATVALTPGETLWMRVAGAGGNGFEQVFGLGVTVTAAGGLWGGGSNWVECPYSECIATLGGAGGGASDVRT